MEVKAEVANGTPAVKTENQNQPKPSGPQDRRQGQESGPSGMNKFNKGNLMNKNKNFQQRGNMRPMGGGPGNRGPPKSEVSTFPIYRVSFAIFVLLYQFSRNFLLFIIKTFKFLSIFT